jgi:hypothetical protein
MVMRLIGIQTCDLNEILIQAQHRKLCFETLYYQIQNEFISLLTLFAEATTATQAQNIPSISIVALLGQLAGKGKRGCKMSKTALTLGSDQM